MAFPPPANALVDLHSSLPWAPGPATILVSAIPIVQLKDYAAFLDPESDAFNKSLMVRWIMDGSKGADVFFAKSLPKHSAPLPGAFMVYGQVCTVAYECLYAEPIMEWNGESYVHKYWYLFLRQVTPADSEPAVPLAPQGGNDYTEAVLLETVGPYILPLQPGEEELWWKVEGLNTSFNFLGGITFPPGLEGVDLNLYFADPPLTPDDTFEATGEVDVPIGYEAAYIQVTKPASTEGLIYWIVDQQDPATEVTGSSSYTTATVLVPNQDYVTTLTSAGTAYWFAFPLLDSMGIDFEVIQSSEPTTSMYQSETFMNEDPPSMVKLLVSGDGSDTDTTEGAPFLFKLVMTYLDGDLVVRFRINII